MRRGHWISAEALLLVQVFLSPRAAVAVSDRPAQSAARVVVEETPEARRGREIAEWNARVDRKKRAK